MNEILLEDKYWMERKIEDVKTKEATEWEK